MVIGIPGYNYEFTATEREKIGTLVYISQDLIYKSRSDLNISQIKQLESNLIEVVNENRKNTIVGCIYKHPNMSITEFISDFLEPRLTKISFEKKEVMLLGNYNINLLSCESDKNTCDFLELMLFFSFMPKIMNPTRIIPCSQTLIDNIFYNIVQPKIIAGNVATDISDHLIQFIAIPSKWRTEHLNEDIYRRNYKTLNHDKLKEDFNKFDWAILLSDNNIDVAYDNFLGKVENLINKHLPLEIVSKSNLKQQKRKPWISNDLLKQISYKNKLHKKSQTEKDFNRWNDLINEIKVLQNSLRKRIQLENDNYYRKFFKEK